MKLKKISVYFILFTIIFIGLWFRLKGISTNHSFWADEAWISSFARDISSGKTGIFDGMRKVYYEPLQIGITAISFKLLGPTEYSARLPSAIFGTVGIIFAYLIASKLSNQGGGMLAAFMFCFSQLNIANSTQAKPYTALTTFLLIIIYLLIQVQEKRTHLQLLAFHILIVSLIILSSFFHYVGFMFWIIYVIFMILKYHRFWQKIIRHPVYLILLFISLAVCIYLSRINHAFSELFRPHQGKIFFLADNTMYFKNLFLRQYGIFLLPAVTALILLFKKNRALTIGIFLWIFSLILIWNYRVWSHNIRYLVPLFGIVFVFFGTFWGIIGKKYFSRVTWLPAFIVIMVLVLVRYKIVLKPLNYYSPNVDFYGDVQVADYKTMFDFIKKKVPDYKKMVIFNDMPDAQRWYLDKQSDAYFKKGFGRNNPEVQITDGKKIYKTLDQFLAEISKYPKGILIVEDWESYLPEEIKQYAKNNMQLIFRVNGLSQAKNDPWPLKIYSWGL